MNGDVDERESVVGRRRVAVVHPDPAQRAAIIARLDRLPDVTVVAWAEDADALLLLGTCVDLCLCATAPDADCANRLRERGTEVRVLGRGDPVAALRRPAPAPVARPRLAARQREVLVAVVTGNELLTTVARRLGINEQTVKTHLRRIRAKYAELGRPAPTRRDLYVRAIEDGLIPPPGQGTARG